MVLRRSSSSPLSIQDRDTLAFHSAAQISLFPDCSSHPPHRRRLCRRRGRRDSGLRAAEIAGAPQSSLLHPTPPYPAPPPPRIFRRFLRVSLSASPPPTFRSVPCFPHFRP